MGMASSVPTGTPSVSTDAEDSTRTVTVVHRKRRPRFFWRAPGSRPASVSTWKPLQIPTTGPPAAANRPTASMIGEKRAMAPGRR